MNKEKLFRMIEHLLPKAKAWTLPRKSESNNYEYLDGNNFTLLDGNNYTFLGKAANSVKRIPKFFDGLASWLVGIVQYIDLVYLDLFPDSTRELEQWEHQFNLPAGTLTEQERRDRLASRWSDKGGQSPRYIQDTLQGAGFDVYVHDFWVPGTEAAIGVHACAQVRNPHAYLGQQVLTQCGEPLMQCGEPEALCGNFTEGGGYPLVNKVYTAKRNETALCGEPLMECGEPEALCGNWDGMIFERKTYTIPNDSSKYPYFMYVGGETFPTMASVPLSRKDEFEDLCLKICPEQLWIGILVNYI
jgi:hypothetical protein